MTDVPPTPPPPPPPSAAPQPVAAPRPGMPVWGWVLIGVGGLVLIGVIAIVVVAVVLVSTLRPEPADPIGAPTAAPSSEATVAPTEPGSGPFSLDTIAVAPMGPFWSVPGAMLTDWDTVVFDENGLNHFQNAELGCDFRTYQATGAGDPSGTSDRPASEAQMDVLADVWIGDEVSSVVREPKESVWLDFDMSTEAEFLVDRVDGVYADTGVATTTYLIGREFLASGGALAARLECRTDTFDGPDSPLGWILDDLGVVTF